MASTKVRGITIELGADTEGLNKALSKVNTEIGQTQRQLKDVERLLKLDPGNTELLAEKQRMLADRVTQTKDKIETLKDAQEKMVETFGDDIDKGQYDALTREIISCEQELKNLEKAAAESNVTLQKISVAGDKMQEAGGKISDVGKSLTQNVTMPIVGLGAAALKTTADFDAAMSKVRAISGASGEDFELLRNKAREMGAETKFSATEAANAMEYMAMAGWDTTQMLDGIGGIMSLAAASGEDLATTSDIVTDALTAFGLKAEDSADFADLLAKTAASANTNVAMMGETFKYAAPVMGAMGYSAEDAALAIGLMGNAGIKASSAGTALRGMISRMAKPTDEVAEAMDRLGIELYNDEGQMYSFYEIMEQMRAGFGNINMPVEQFNTLLEGMDKNLADGTITEKQYNEALDEYISQTFGAEEAEKARAAAMLAGKNALSGLLAIVNASDEDFNKLKNNIDNSKDAADDMAKIMQDNASGQIEILMSQLQELAISFGDILIPVFRELVTIIQGVVEKFNSLDDSQKETIVKVAAVVAAIGPLLVVLGSLMGAIGNILTVAPKLAPMLTPITTAFKALWGVIMANPLIAVTAAVIAFVALIATKGDEIQKLLKKVDDFLQNIFAKDFTKVFGPLLGGVLNTFMKNISNWWNGFKTALNGVIDFIRGVFTGDWQRAWNGVKQIFSGVFQSLVAIAKAPINGVIGLINALLSGINAITTKVNDKLGKDLPTFGQIPLLAKGGVVTQGSAIVGEAGAELLSVSNGAARVQPLTGGTGAGHTDITDLLETYLPYLADGKQIVLDTGAIVGGTAYAMNNALGQIAARAGGR